MRFCRTRHAVCQHDSIFSPQRTGQTRLSLFFDIVSQCRIIRDALAHDRSLMQVFLVIACRRKNKLRNRGFQIQMIPFIAFKIHIVLTSLYCVDIFNLIKGSLLCAVCPCRGCFRFLFGCCQTSRFILPLDFRHLPAQCIKIENKENYQVHHCRNRCRHHTDQRNG